MRKLRKLRVLSLEDTQVSTLPDWIGELPLEKLRLPKRTLARGEITRLARLTRAQLELR